MPTIATWDEILETSEYQQDLAVLTRMVTNSVANAELVDESNPFVYVVASLSAVLRYYIRHSVDLKDIDLTPYMDLIKKEVGVDLPLTDAIPIVEFVRENKHWYGHKGGEVLYHFIGSLIGSPIELHYPKDLIFTYNKLRSRWSGALSDSGPLPWDQTCRSRFRDGLFWSKYTYVVDVLQAQDVSQFTDLTNLLNSIHPAGTKAFIEFDMRYIPTGSHLDTITMYQDDLHDHWFLSKAWPTLDNGWSFNKLDSRWSMHGGTMDYSDIYVAEIPDTPQIAGYRRLSSARLFTQHFIDDCPWRCYKRDIPQTDGSYSTVYSDTDSQLYDNATTNIGIGGYTISSVGTLTLQEVQHWALDLDGQNMNGPWLYDTAEFSLLEDGSEI